MAKRGRKKKGSRRRRAKSRIRKFARGQKSSFQQLGNAVSAVVFLSQLTQKDRDAGAYNVGSMGQKAKVFVNNIGGRILGINPFPDIQTFPQTINLDGAANKYTGFGLATFLYGLLPIKGLPHKGKAKSLGKKIAVAGILGGIFDAPENAGASPAVRRQNPVITSHNRSFITNGRQITTV